MKIRPRSAVALKFGASGFIPKSVPVETIRDGVMAVLEGEVWTPPDINLESPEGDEASEMAARLSSLTPQQVPCL